MAASGESLHDILEAPSPWLPEASSPRLPERVPAPAPPPLDLRRALSTPTGGSAGGPLQPIPYEDFRRAEESRRRPRKSPDEGRLALARAVEALAAKVEGLGARMEEERLSGVLREANISRLAEVLATATENAAIMSAPPEPLATERTVREEEIEAVVESKARARDERLLEAIAGMGAQLERQVVQQEQQWAWQQRLLEEKASNVHALQEVVEAVRSLKGPSCSEVPSESSANPEPRYRPHVGVDGLLYEFPEVQVAVKINQVSNVDTKQLTFEADFVCFLDWCDPNVADTPSDELKTLDWTQYFNPQIEVDNAKDKSGWLDGMDDIPRRPRTAAGAEGSSSIDTLMGGCSSLALGPRLRKTMRFRGVLSMSAVNLKCFPFDIQMLPIKLKAARCRGLALGTPSVSWAQREQVSRVHLTDGLVPRTPGYLESHIRAVGQGHYAMPSAGDSLLEFRICGLTGYHQDPHRGDIYDVSIFVARPFFASYFWDLVIMNLFVMLAATAFWDTAAPELSSRMSISLTVILTLAAYTSSRPEPIAKAPYVTFHDWCEQMSMFLVTGISAQNVFAVVMCGGQHGEAPPYMVAEFQDNQERCALGWCKSRSVDCQGLVVLLVTWLLLIVYSCIWLVRTRRRATKELRERFPNAIVGKGREGTGVGFGKAHSDGTSSSHSLDSWSTKAKRCFSSCLSSMARGCWRCLCWRTAVEVNLSDDKGENSNSPQSVNARASLVGPESSPDNSPSRPRPRPLTLGLDSGESPKCSPSSSASPHLSRQPSPASSQVRTPSRPSRVSATPPTSARFGVPTSTSPAVAASPWQSGLAPISPSLQTSSHSSFSHETSVSSRRPFFA